MCDVLVCVCVTHTHTHTHAHTHKSKTVNSSSGSIIYILCIFTVGTWLILPVVICLSQRLSHACLSISLFIRRDCGWLIKSVIVYLMVSFVFFLPTWITVVILELIHEIGRAHV